MEIYKFKCNCCGSTRCEKLPDGYKCKYCGNIQDIIFSKEEKKKEPEEKAETVVTTVVQKETSQQETVLSINKPAFKQALINFLICLFGGWFGLHEFLKGKIFWGIVYALTFGLFGIGYALDCIFAFFGLLGSLKVGDGQ